MAEIINNTTWAILKDLVDRGANLHFTENSQKYELRVINGPLTYEFEIFKSGHSVDNVVEPQNTNDRDDFETNYKSNANPIESTKVEATFATGVDLDVNIQSSSGLNSKLRYDKITENQTINNGSYTTVYTYAGTGNFYGAFLQFNAKEMDIKITVDGEDIMTDFPIENLPKEEGITPFIWRPDDKEVSIKFPDAMKYTTDIKILVRCSKNNKKLDTGYVVLTKVT